MISEIDQLLTSLVREVSDFCQSQVVDSHITTKRRETVGLAGLAIHELLSTLRVSAIDNLQLEKLLYRVYNVVYDEAYLFYYTCFHSSYDIVKSGEAGRTQGIFTKANVVTLALRLKLRVVQMGFARFGDSTDSYFLSRVERLIWGIKAVFSMGFTDFYELCLFTILNVHQTLIELAIFNDGEMAKDHVTSVLSEVRKLFTYFGRRDIRIRCASNAQLSFFLVDQELKYQALQHQPATHVFPNVNLVDLSSLRQLWSLSSLSSHDQNKFRNTFTELLPRWMTYSSELDERSKVILMSLAVRYLHQRGQTEINNLGIRITSDQQVDINGIFESYFRHYNLIPTTSVSDAEVSILLGFNDKELREHVGKSMTNLNPVEVLREYQKPHGVSEISDLEVSIRLLPDRTHYLCMPFKSGLEIPGNSVPVKYFHQIFRPFVAFEHCVLIFVSAKRCSEALHNLVKQTRDRLNWPIGILEYRELAALLKLNGQLSNPDSN